MKIMKLEISWNVKDFPFLYIIIENISMNASSVLVFLAMVNS